MSEAVPSWEYSDGIDTPDEPSAESMDSCRGGVRPCCSVCGSTTGCRIAGGAAPGGTRMGGESGGEGCVVCARGEGRTGTYDARSERSAVREGGGALGGLLLSLSSTLDVSDVLGTSPSSLVGTGANETLFCVRDAMRSRCRGSECLDAFTLGVLRPLFFNAERRRGWNLGSAQISVTVGKMIGLPASVFSFLSIFPTRPIRRPLRGRGTPRQRVHRQWHRLGATCVPPTTTMTAQ